MAKAASSVYQVFKLLKLTIGHHCLYLQAMNSLETNKMIIT